MQKKLQQKEQKVTHLVENEFDFEVFLTGMMQVNTLKESPARGVLKD